MALAPAAAARPTNRWLHVAIAVLLTVSVGLQVVRDRGWQPYQPATPVLWFQSGPLLKRVALGFENVLADVYWMRAVIYYGSRSRVTTNRNYDLLDPLLTFVTTLDPQFRLAYRFGSVFLAEGYPNGAGRPDRAIALLDRAVAANPDSWEYPYDIGFVHYWWLKDYVAAAQSFERAAQRPAAPQWLTPLAATTLAQGGNRRASRMLWQRIHEDSDGAMFRQNARFRLNQLDAMDVLDALNAAAARFAASEGRPPRNWAELIASQRLRGIPLDPTGVPYELDQATGGIGLSRQSELWPLPTEKPVAPPSPR